LKQVKVFIGQVVILWRIHRSLLKGELG